MPQISVIVPVYRVEAYLSRCVESILNQTFRDFDLILVDDGSPDQCGKLCEEYACRDSRVHVIHQENAGLSAARNRGIDWAAEHSDSQWLAFVDSDDWIHPAFLERLYTIARDTGCSLSACGFLRTGGEDFGEERTQDCTVLSADAYYCGGEIPSGTVVVAWNKLYRKSLFADLRYPAGKLHEDEFTTYRAVYQAEKVAVTREPLYAYFQNTEGIIRSKWTPRKLDIVEAVEAQAAFARENNNPVLLRKALEDYIYRLHEQMAFAKDWGDSGRRKLLSVLRKKMRRGLKQGKALSLFPFSRKFLWVYEEAYPAKPVWWVVCKAARMLDRAGEERENP